MSPYISAFEPFSSHGTKAMRKLENSVIPCSAEIDLTRIPTVGNVTEINCTSKTWKFCGNLTKILTEIITEMVPEITKIPLLTEFLVKVCKLWI